MSQRVVVSLTTVPQRFPLIKETLLSLDKQNVDAVYLNVPTHSLKNRIDYEVPDWFENTHWDKVKINRTSYDYGPITKLIPTLYKETDPETIIIICDDDNVYREGWAEQFADKVEDTCYVAGSGGNTICILQDMQKKTEDVEIQNKLVELFKDNHFDFLEGFCGMACKRKNYEDKPLIEMIYSSKSCFFSDDLVIAKYLYDKGIKRKIMKLKDIKYESCNDYDNPSISLLYNIEGTGGNVENYQRAFSHLSGKIMQVNELVNIGSL